MKVLALAWTMVCFAAKAHAATHLEVAWAAPAVCPSELEVEQRLLRLRTDETAGAELQVSGTIDERAGQFHLQLATKLNGRSGQRELVGETCEEVTQAAVAVLALLLDAESAPAEGFPAPPVSPPVVHGSESKPRASAPASLRRARPGRPKYFVAAGAGMGGFLLPEVAITFEGRAGIRGSAWSLQALGQLWPARPAQVTSVPRAGAEVSMLNAGILACRELPVSARVWRLCAGVEGDWARARGFGVQEARSVQKFGLAGVLGVGLSIRISRLLSLGWNLEAVAPSSRPRFVLDNVGPVFRRSALGARTTLGLEIVF